MQNYIKLKIKKCIIFIIMNIKFELNNYYNIKYILQIKIILLKQNSV